VTSSGGAAAGGSTSAGSNCSSGGNTGGNTGTAQDLIYSLDGFNIAGAYYTGSSVLALASFNAPAIGNGTVADMTIVNGQFLYQPFVPTSGTSDIQGFSIAHSTGALSAIGGSPFPSHSVTDSLVADPKSRFLFAAESGTSTVESYQVNPTTGALTLVPGGPISLSFVPLSITVDGSGNYLYVGTDSGVGWVYGFNIDQTSGALTPIVGSPWPLSVVEVGGETTGQFLIGRGAGVLQVFGLESGTGTPLPITSISPVSNATNHFVVHPSGKFIYTFSQQVSGGSNFPVEGFLLDASGNITAMSASPFSKLTSIYAGKIDQNGTAMVGLTPSGQFQVFAIDPTTGLLTAPAQPYSGVANVFFAVTN
jgi:6-phosphogluconolactonase